MPKGWEFGLLLRFLCPITANLFTSRGLELKHQGRNAITGSAFSRRQATARFSSRSWASRSLLAEKPQAARTAASRAVWAPLRAFAPGSSRVR
jgi:hypothetical protein